MDGLSTAHSELYKLVQDEVKQELKTDYTNLTSQLQNDYINSDNKIIQKVNELTKEVDEIKKQLNEIIKKLNKL